MSHEVSTPQSGDRPVIIFGIDGTLLTYDEAGEYLNSEPPHALQRPDKVKGLYYLPEHGVWINRLLRFMDGYYISANNAHSHENAGRLIGIPPLSWIKFQGLPRTSENMWTSAVDATFPDRHLAWIDCNHEQSSFVWAERRREQSQLQTLLVKPDTNLGMQYEHAVQVEHWLDWLRATNVLKMI